MIHEIWNKYKSSILICIYSFIVGCVVSGGVFVWHYIQQSRHYRAIESELTAEIERCRAEIDGLGTDLAECKDRLSVCSVQIGRVYESIGECKRDVEAGREYCSTISGATAKIRAEVEYLQRFYDSVGDIYTSLGYNFITKREVNK